MLRKLSLRKIEGPQRKMADDAENDGNESLAPRLCAKYRSVQDTGRPTMCVLEKYYLDGSQYSNVYSACLEGNVPRRPRRRAGRAVARRAGRARAARTRGGSTRAAAPTPPGTTTQRQHAQHEARRQHAVAHQRGQRAPLRPPHTPLDPLTLLLVRRRVNKLHQGHHASVMLGRNG